MSFLTRADTVSSSHPTSKPLSTVKDGLNHTTISYKHQVPHKRAIARSRPIDLCPRGTGWNTFWYSHCERYRSPQAYSGYCLTGSPYEFNIDGEKVFGGECLPGEFCVDSFFPDGLKSTAYCISTDDFVKYALSSVQEEKEEGQTAVDFAQLESPSENGVSDAASEYSVEAVLTGTSPQESVFAANLEIQAQKPTFVRGAPLWKTLDDGLNRCSTCAGVGMSVVPNGTQRLLLSTALAAGVAMANIWLTVWKPGVDS